MVRSLCLRQFNSVDHKWHLACVKLTSAGLSTGGGYAVVDVSARQTAAGDGKWWQLTAVDGRAPEMDCALVRRQWRFDKSTSADQTAH